MLGHTVDEFNLAAPARCIHCFLFWQWQVYTGLNLWRSTVPRLCSPLASGYKVRVQRIPSSRRFGCRLFSLQCWGSPPKGSTPFKDVRLLCAEHQSNPRPSMPGLQCVAKYHNRAPKLPRNILNELSSSVVQRTHCVAHEDAGAAAGLVNVAHQLGGSRGLAILVVVFAAAGSATLDARHLLAHRVATSLTVGSAMLKSAPAFLSLGWFAPPQPAGVEEGDPAP